MWSDYNIDNFYSSQVLSERGIFTSDGSVRVCYRAGAGIGNAGDIVNLGDIIEANTDYTLG